MRAGVERPRRVSIIIEQSLLKSNPEALPSRELYLEGKI
jgi:hypothetical protein